MRCNLIVILVQAHHVPTRPLEPHLQLIHYSEGRIVLYIYIYDIYKVYNSIIIYIIISVYVHVYGICICIYSVCVYSIVITCNI